MDNSLGLPIKIPEGPLKLIDYNYKRITGKRRTGRAKAWANNFGLNLSRPLTWFIFKG